MYHHIDKGLTGPSKAEFMKRKRPVTFAENSNFWSDINVLLLFVEIVLSVFFCPGSQVPIMSKHPKRSSQATL